MGDSERLTAKQFQQAGGVEDWRVLRYGASAWFDAPSQTAGAGFVRRVAELSTGLGRSADVDLRVNGVHVRISTLGSPGLTRADVAAARAISAAARELGLAADPSALQFLQLTLDTLDRGSTMAFWRSVMRYQPLGEEVLVDSMRRDPPLWFQQQDTPRPLRNRIHLDVAHPHLLTLEAVDGATAGGAQAYAGGHHAALADPEGNEVDVIPLAPADTFGDDPGIADWRELFGGMTFYPVTSPGRAADLATVVAELADDAGLPLLVDLRPDGVTIDTGKDQWEDERFLDLARRVQTAARKLGLTVDTRRLRFVQIGIAVVDIPALRAFWKAVLGYEYDPRPGVTDIYDPRRLNPPIFFQQMSASEEARRAQRNRIHIDVYVPDDQAQARIDAALAAGGRVVYDDEAPEWWTLADPEGNEVDIAVVVGREELWAPARSETD
ncbi:VOC family protein [Actinopolymorpha sp. NPDC004070]|uniref:VOC family protein n=1 Tax=Actinopolymorpha sp. NPDC004070 TaxID=3154548 RepID=UPI0033BB8C24